MIEQRLTKEQARLHEACLYRQRRVIDSPPGAEIISSGRRLLNFSSNDYLGLANHPRLIAALKRGAERYGTGSGASHLVTGHSSAHHALEEELAAFTQRPRALLFSSGYMANLGLISTLVGRGDWLLQDRLNHASLIDAGPLSRARTLRYQHADPDSLKQRLEGLSDGARLIATDGIFSMDGDAAPLNEIAQICQQYQGFLMVDDAHGIGVIGESGRGTCERFGLGVDEVPALVVTCGKALGSFGAFVAGDETLIEGLIQGARSYIYTTAIPAAQAEVTRESLRILEQESWRRQQLHASISRFRVAAQQLSLPLMPSNSAIQPLLIGPPEKTLAISEALLERGILCSAIRPPTVPEGASRLRITITATHSDEQIDRLLDALDKELLR